jgi:prepilin-type N-terminal cleavage/methylation domain-containing protein
MLRRYDKFPSGFSIVEMLIALAIMAMLLTAVAIAFNASITNYVANGDIFRSINDARQALSRITTQLRTAIAVDPAAASNECSLITADGSDITYRYDSTNNTLYLITNDNTTDSDYVLSENVMAMTFAKETFVDGTEIKVRSVQISMSVGTGKVDQKLAAAAVVRKNL